MIEINIEDIIIKKSFREIILGTLPTLIALNFAIKYENLNIKIL